MEEYTQSWAQRKLTWGRERMSPLFGLRTVLFYVLSTFCTQELQYISYCMLYSTNLCHFNTDMHQIPLGGLTGLTTLVRRINRCAFDVNFQLHVIPLLTTDLRRCTQYRTRPSEKHFCYKMCMNMMLEVDLLQINFPIKLAKIFPPRFSTERLLQSSYGAECRRLRRYNLS